MYMYVHAGRIIIYGFSAVLCSKFIYGKHVFSLTMQAFDLLEWVRV